MSPTKPNRANDTGRNGHQIIDARRLLYFYHVAKAGRFTAAEATLDVAQSAMSRQIQQLEADLGVQLLDRTGHGVRMTDLGQILYRNAEMILQSMSATLDELEEARHTPLGSVSIAAPPTFTSTYMAEVISRFAQRCPDVRIVAVEASTGAVYSQLTDGIVDVAIVIQAVNASRLDLQELLTEPMHLMAAPDHPIGKMKVVSRAKLDKVNLLLPASLHGTRSILKKYFAPTDILLRSQTEVDSLPLMLQLLEKGHYSAILPPSAAQAYLESGQLIARPLRPALTRTVYLARLKNPPLSENQRILLDCVVETVKAAQVTKTAGTTTILGGSRSF